MNKKSQITFFIILAIIILIISGVYFSIEKIKKPSYKEPKELQIDSSNLEQFTSECLKVVTLEAIKKVSLQGGVYPSHEPYTDFKSLLIPIYVYNEKVNYPSINEIEKNIESYVKDNLKHCTNNYKDFKQFYDIEFSQEEVHISLGKQVLITLNQDIKLTKGKNSKKIQNINTKLNLNYIKIYEVIKTIMNAHYQNPTFFPNSLMTNLAEEKGFYFQKKYQKSEIIVQLLFKKIYKSEDIMYIYAVQI